MINSAAVGSYGLHLCGREGPRRILKGLYLPKKYTLRLNRRFTCFFNPVTALLLMSRRRCSAEYPSLFVVVLTSTVISLLFNFKSTCQLPPLQIVLVDQFLVVLHKLPYFQWLPKIANGPNIEPSYVADENFWTFNTSHMSNWRENPNCGAKSIPNPVHQFI